MTKFVISLYLSSSQLKLLAILKIIYFYTETHSYLKLFNENQTATGALIAGYGS